jgi:amidase
MLRPNDDLGAFCADSDAYLKGAPDGSLSGLTFAAKDIFDVAGHVTGAGNPDWKATHGPARRTAWAVDVLVKSGATMVGKTVTDELTRGILGENPHYGTPVNPRAPSRVPGGSSSGSASAVAGGLVDFALGSDSGGSVRAPASFCGIYGMRPTHGSVPVNGILPQAPSYDTVGWFAHDMETFERVGQVLLQADAQVPRPRRLVIARDAFDAADKEVVEALKPALEVVGSLLGVVSEQRVSTEGLEEWSWQQRVLQGMEAWHTLREWLERVNPRLAFSVASRYMVAAGTTEVEMEDARSMRGLVLAQMNEVLGDGVVVCLPTTPMPAPQRGQTWLVGSTVGPRVTALTCIAGTTGCPQISIPVAEVGGLPVGLSLLGARGSDHALISLASELEKLCG